MIGVQVPVPVKKEDGEYIVPTKTRGSTSLQPEVEGALYDLNCTMKEVLCELKLLNARVEEAFETKINQDDI